MLTKAVPRVISGQQLPFRQDFNQKRQQSPQTLTFTVEVCPKHPAARSRQCEQEKTKSKWDPRPFKPKSPKKKKKRERERERESQPASSLDHVSLYMLHGTVHEDRTHCAGRSSGMDMDLQLPFETPPQSLWAQASYLHSSDVCSFFPPPTPRSQLKSSTADPTRGLYPFQ